MLVVERPGDLAAHVGQKIGTSEWIVVTQSMIDCFADATHDHQWIHVDAERAKREAPGGTTIAHGFLTLSLIAGAVPEIYRVEKRSRSLNYGLNKVRFPSPVPVGSRVRVSMTMESVDIIDNGVRAIIAVVVEVENSPRPACVAETITVIYN